MREMKDSGIEWIGEIPKNSSLIPLKYLSSIIRGGSPRPIASFLTDEINGYNWIKIGDTKKDSKYITKTKFKIKLSGLNSTRLVKKGSLLLTNSMSFGEPYILKIDGCIHDGWVSLFDFRNVVQEYLYYCLLSKVCRVQFERLTDGGVVQNLNIDKIASVKVVLFDLTEQKQIANFLDSKCSEIDATAEDIQKEISLLEDYKKSVITEAVTKGLNPDAEMKDSGIAWIGEIPKGWKVIRLKYITNSIGDGLHGTPNYDDLGTISFINGNNLGNRKISITEKTNRLTEEEYKKYGVLKLDKRTLLMSLNGTYGTLSMYDNEPIMLSKSVGYINVCNKETKEYLYYFFTKLFSPKPNDNKFSGNNNCKSVISDSKKFKNLFTVNL